jgi:hypothetical protein
VVQNAYYSPEVHGAYELFELGDFPLERGGTLSDAAIAFVTFGELNAAKGNAILFPTWYSGTHKMLADVYVGSEHALNPDRYFIVLANQLGDGLSTSPHNSEGKQAMDCFPALNIGDDVRAQERLLHERFGVEQLALVDGGSASVPSLRRVWTTCAPGTRSSSGGSIASAAACATSLTLSPSSNSGRSPSNPYGSRSTRRPRAESCSCTCSPLLLNSSVS